MQFVQRCLFINRYRVGGANRPWMCNGIIHSRSIWL